MTHTHTTISTRGWSDVWWRRIPLKAARVSTHLATALFDGFYLLRWPRVALIAPPAVFIMGFLLGAVRLFPGETFTFSILLMTILLIPASFSAALGCWTTAGYALGDFFFFRPRLFQTGLLLKIPVTVLTRIGVPALILYALLAGLLVFVPLIALGLGKDLYGKIQKRLTGSPTTIQGKAMSSVNPTRQSKTLELVVAAAINGLLQAGLVYVWIHIVPTLIRPIYTWINNNPPVPAMASLQNRSELLILISAVLGFSRIILERTKITRREVYENIKVVFDSMRDLMVTPPKRLPAILGITLRASVTTLMLSGILTSYTEAAILFSVLLVAMAVRDRLLPFTARLFERLRVIPAALRLIAAAAISYVVSTMVVQMMWNSSGSSFRPLIASVCLSLLVFAILLPQQGKERTSGLSTTRTPVGAV